MAKVLNIHEREMRAAAEAVGALLDSLSSAKDVLWPHRSWPRMAFDRPLGVGATGGHGPIRYVVEAYTRGRAIRFRFVGPKGFDGHHGFEGIPTPHGSVVLRHSLVMTTRGLATLTWPLVYRPLHDALIEDALATAEASLGLAPRVRPWPIGVKLLRRMFSRGGSRPQIVGRPGPG